MFPHLADTFLDDALDRAAPPGVKNADSPPFPIRQNDGKAIGGLHGHEQSRSVRDNSVSGQRLFRHAVDAMDQIRMNLPQRNQRPVLASVRRAQFLEEKLAVALDGCARVMLREAKIQRISAVDARHSAKPRREAMHQPGQFAQLLGTQKL